MLKPYELIDCPIYSIMGFLGPVRSLAMPVQGAQTGPVYHGSLCSRPKRSCFLSCRGSLNASRRSNSQGKPANCDAPWSNCSSSHNLTSATPSSRSCLASVSLFSNQRSKPDILNRYRYRRSPTRSKRSLASIGRESIS